MYGHQLILDCQGCDVNGFNYLHVRDFMRKLCGVLDVERVTFTYDQSEWGDGTIGNPKTFGVTATQSLVASSIVVHLLQHTGQVFVDIFTCGPLDGDQAWGVVEDYFKPTSHTGQMIERGKHSGEVETLVMEEATTELPERSTSCSKACEERQVRHDNFQSMVDSAVPNEAVSNIIEKLREQARLGDVDSAKVILQLTGARCMM